LRQPYGVATDFYSLGVICYECMLGKVRLNIEADCRNHKEGNKRADSAEADYFAEEGDTRKLVT